MATTLATEVAFDNQVKPSLSGRTRQATSEQVVSSLPGTSYDGTEARYWADKYGLGVESTDASKKSTVHPRKAKLQAISAAVVHNLAFGPPLLSKVAPLAVASGPRVRLYYEALHLALRGEESTTPSEEKTDIAADRQVPTGGSLALHAAFRHDGRLLAVATDQGQVRISNATSRATLRTFQGPNRLAVRSVSWFRNGQDVWSAGDDGVARVWSLQSTELDRPKLELTGHGDAIRSAALWQAPLKSQSKWPHASLAFTGSYDHTIRIWNVNDDDTKDRCLAVLSHGAPVETLLTMPSSNPDVPVWLLSAGGTVIKVWNPQTGRAVCQLETRHRKTITSLAAVPVQRDPDDSLVQMRILTGGLDALLRIYTWNSHTGTLAHIHGATVEAPVTALAYSDAQRRLALGTVDGTVLIRQEGVKPSAPAKREAPRAGTYAFVQRGMDAAPSVGDVVLADREPNKRARRLEKYDIALRQFRYGEALDDALETRQPAIVAAVLEELGRRRGLILALSNRDEETLEPLLSFTTRYIAHAKFSSLLIGVANKLLDIYGRFGGQSEVIDELFQKLKVQVSTEVKDQMRLLGVSGALDGLITSIAMANERDD